MAKGNKVSAVRIGLAQAFAKSVARDVERELLDTVGQLTAEDVWKGNYPTREAILDLIKDIADNPEYL